MKTYIKLITGLATVFFATVQVKSQTLSDLTATNGTFGDGLKIMANAMTSGTNWTMIGGYGHSLKGKNNLAFADLAYNFNSNVGVVVGYDDLWTTGASQFNAVKGGVTLQTEIHPFAWTGVSWLSDIKGQPFLGALIATPRGGGNIGTILTTGINFEVVDFSKYSLDLGVQYESRSGQSGWDGGYGLVHGGFSRKF